MPRSAATLFGLAFVAFSIGFNTWRYPIVWQMAGATTASAAPTPAAMKAAPAAADESPKPSAAAPTAQPGKLPAAEAQPATPSLMLGAQAAQKPIAGTANESAIGNARPLAAKPAMDVASLARPGPLDSNGLEKPLVPIPRMGAVAKVADTSGTASAVRRLPPVDPNVPPMGTYASGSSGDAIPIYPSTAIQ